MNSSDGTMRAMQASDSNAASLSFDQVPIPRPEPGEVLVRVAATAVTAQELTWPEKWPAIPCHDLSGVVAGSGPGGTGWADGTEVFGLVGFDRPGAAAEYVTVPAADLAAKPAAVDHVAGSGPGGTGWADGTEVFGLVGFDRPGAAAEYVTVPAADLAAKPAAVDHVAAAAIPLGGLTAWQALHDHAGLQPGQHVLVHGGAGGVGAYAVQVAVALGAQVTATASTRDAAYVGSLGAHRVINYKGRFEDELSDVDVVVDPVGGGTLARSWTVLKPGGILVAIAEVPPEDKGGRDDVRALFFVVEPNGAQLAELARLVDDGKLRAAVSTTFALGDLREAFAAQQARSHPGKVVITVA